MFSTFFTCLVILDRVPDIVNFTFVVYIIFIPINVWNFVLRQSGYLETDPFSSCFLDFLGGTGAVLTLGLIILH